MKRSDKLRKYGLSLRLLNCCDSIGISTVGELYDCPRRKLLQIRNFGRKCMTEVDELFDDVEFEPETSAVEDDAPLRVEVDMLTSWSDVYDAARWTEGKEPCGSMPSTEWCKKMARAEHSPLRCLMYRIRMVNIPYWVSVHLVRHKYGVEHFVSTQRDDRREHEVSRANMPQNTPVNHMMVLNAQALINISRVRLCGKASEETRKVWREVVGKVLVHTPELGDLLVPNCKYRGRCPEMKPCKPWMAHD